MMVMVVVLVVPLMMMLTVFGDGKDAQNYCKYVLMAVMAVMPMIFDEGAGALVVLVIIMTAQPPFVFQWKTRKSVFFLSGVSSFGP